MDQYSKYREPGTGAALQFRDGALVSPTSGREYPIIGGIPRFCSSVSYAENFGDQWNVFSKTQLDSGLQNKISAARLWAGTEWNPKELDGKILLEIGCGAGRFTGSFLEAGAEVWSVDLSSAVNACYRNHGQHKNLHVSQASVFDLPFSPGSFDYVFMFGVMQHTPSPVGALKTALAMACPNGKVAVDVYHRKQHFGRFTSKYRWRWLTTKLPPVFLRQFITWYIPRWIKIDDWLADHTPEVCEKVATIIPCWNYRGMLSLTEEQRVEWAILDTYDALGACYDTPFSRKELARCLREIDGIDFWIKRGGNGLETGLNKLAVEDKAGKTSPASI